MSMTHHIPEKKNPIACTYEETKKKIKLIDHLLTLTGFSLSNVAFCKQIAIPLLVGLQSIPGQVHLPGGPKKLKACGCPSPSR